MSQATSTRVKSCGEQCRFAHGILIAEGELNNQRIETPIPVEVADESRQTTSRLKSIGEVLDNNSGTTGPS